MNNYNVNQSPSDQWRSDALAERRDRRAHRRFFRRVVLLVLAVVVALIQRAF